MALDFPSSPNINDKYTFGGITWTWDGNSWRVLSRLHDNITESAPETASSPGSSGEIRYDSDYLYICIDTDTWKRTPISSW